ncbi:MAG: group II truncated hemoglobin [Pseudomonadales bacterium]
MAGSDTEQRNRPFGKGDNTFQAIGGEQAINALVKTFYQIMSSNPDYATIWSWHPQDISISRDKLARFLCGWMGGPRRYQEKYGPINIPLVHAHLAVTARERDMWLNCMAQALAQQGHDAELVDYLMHQLAIPAERIRALSEERNAGSSL